MRDEGIGGVWNNPIKIDQAKLFPELPCERTVNEKMITGFIISITDKTYMGRRGKVGVQNLKPILSWWSTPSYFPRKLWTSEGTMDTKWKYAGKERGRETKGPRRRRKPKRSLREIMPKP